MSAADVLRWLAVIALTVGIAFLFRALVSGFRCISDQCRDHNSPGLD